MKRFLACILIAFMLLLTLASCNDGKNNDNETKKTESSSVDESKNSDENGDTVDGGDDDTVETVATVAGKTPLESYKQAFEKINAMTAYDIEISTEYAYNYQGSTEDTSNMLEVYRTDGTSAYYNMNYNNLENSEYIYVGNTMYSTTSDGEKEKNTLTNVDFQLTYAIKSEDVILAVQDSAFDGKKFEKNEDVYYVSVEITPSEYSAFMGITIAQNAICTMGFDGNGNMLSFGLKAAYEASAGIIIDINRTVNFKKIGDIVSISKPDDADTYRAAPAEESLDKSAIESADSVSVADEKTDLVMIDVEGYGKIIVRLYPDVAPKTVENFKNLVSEGYYDGVVFHRVIKDFMIQGGDGQYGDGTGGSDTTIKGEFTSNGFTNNLTHKRGVISMARTNMPNSASSQFFIVHKDSSHLDGQYASFGYVVCGMDVVDAIASVETDANDKPTTEVKMNSIKFVKVN